MVFPEDLQVSRTWLTEKFTTSRTNLLRNFFSGKKVPLKLPSNEDMERNCLSGYLAQYKNHLTRATFDNSAAVNKFVKEIQYIFFSMTEFTFVDVNTGYAFKEKRKNHTVLQIVCSIFIYYILIYYEVYILITLLHAIITARNLFW